MAQSDQKVTFARTVGLPESSEEAVARARSMGSKALLKFSTGKDAIGAALALRRSDFEVRAVYMYPIPGLEFVEESLDYYERSLFGGQRIIRLPHPSLVRKLNGLVFQPPERCRAIEDSELPEYDQEDLNAAAISQLGWSDDDTMTAMGVRAADSPQRYMHFKRGGVNVAGRRFYPIFDWRKAELVDAISRSGVKLPVDYELFGRTFDGIDLRFLLPLRTHRPADYRRVLEWFPLAELEVYRCERRAQR